MPLARLHLGIWYERLTDGGVHQSPKVVRTELGGIALLFTMSAEHRFFEYRREEFTKLKPPGYFADSQKPLVFQLILEYEF